MYLEGVLEPSCVCSTEWTKEAVSILGVCCTGNYIAGSKFGRGTRLREKLCLGRGGGRVERSAKALARAGRRILGIVKGLLKFGGVLLLHVVYLLVGLFPRTPKLWVFGAWDGKFFIDNSRWLFLYLIRERSEIAVKWITRNKGLCRELRSLGLPAFHFWSAAAIWYCIRAGVYVYDSYTNAINHWLSNGAFLVNLWHGVPLKRIERDIPVENHPCYRVNYAPLVQRTILSARYHWLTRKPDLLVSTSPYVTAVFRRAFGVDEKHIAVTGYPRNDLLFGGDDGIVRLRCERDIANQLRTERRNVIGYMPSFRDCSKSNPPIQWGTLSEFLSARGALLVVKMHPFDRSYVDTRGSVLWIPPEVDCTLLLSQVDILISDYSSVIFDFALLDRPIILFPYDLEDYTLKDRGFYEAYQEVAPGPVCRTFDELLQALELVLCGELGNAYSHKRKELVRKYHTYVDGESCRRVF